MTVAHKLRAEADLSRTCRVVPCATPHCRGRVATSDLASAGELYCDDCWEQHAAVSLYRPLPLWLSVTLRLVALLVGFVGAIALLCWAAS